MPEIQKDWLNDSELFESTQVINDQPIPESAKMFCRQPAHTEPVGDEQMKEILKSYNNTPWNRLDY